MFLAKFLVKFLVVLYLLLVKASARVTVHMAVGYFVIENLFLKRMFISSVEIILKIKKTLNIETDIVAGLPTSP